MGTCAKSQKSTLRRRNLKTHQMFSIHTTLEETENATITGHFGFLYKTTRQVIVFESLRFQNVFRPHQNATLTKCSVVVMDKCGR